MRDPAMFGTLVHFSHPPDDCHERLLIQSRERIIPFGGLSFMGTRGDVDKNGIFKKGLTGCLMTIWRSSQA
jgi:hypothetical protein